MRHTKSSIIALIITLSLALTSNALAEPPSIIDAKADKAVERFVAEVTGGKEFLSKVEAYLVFPSVVKAGFVVGGEYGEGALRVGGKTTYYYSMASGSVGFQMGVQETSYILAFMTKSALNGFINSKHNGWEAGVDGAVTVVKWGASKDIGSISFEKPIYAFVFDAKGLMYNLSIKGTKFTKIKP